MEISTVPPGHQPQSTHVTDRSQPLVMDFKSCIPGWHQLDLNQQVQLLTSVLDKIRSSGRSEVESIFRAANLPPDLDPRRNSILNDYDFLERALTYFCCDLPEPAGSRIGYLLRKALHVTDSSDLNAKIGPLADSKTSAAKITAAETLMSGLSKNGFWSRWSPKDFADRVVLQDTSTSLVFKIKGKQPVFAPTYLGARLVEYKDEETSLKIVFILPNSKNSVASQLHEESHIETALRWGKDTYELTAEEYIIDEICALLTDSNDFDPHQVTNSLADYQYRWIKDQWFMLVALESSLCEEQGPAAEKIKKNMRNDLESYGKLLLFDPESSIFNPIREAVFKISEVLKNSGIHPQDIIESLRQTPCLKSFNSRF